MAMTLEAERREPSGDLLKNKPKTGGLAPLRYKVDDKESDIGRDARAREKMRTFSERSTHIISHQGAAFMAGNISRAIWMPAGPTSTTKMPGNMKSTSGKINLTAVLAAFSSAIC